MSYKTEVKWCHGRPHPIMTISKAVNLLWDFYLVFQKNYSILLLYFSPTLYIMFWPPGGQSWIVRCFMSVCQMKSNCYSLIYSSLHLMDKCWHPNKCINSIPKFKSLIYPSHANIYFGREDQLHFPTELKSYIKSTSSWRGY